MRQVVKKKKIKNVKVNESAKGGLAGCPGVFRKTIIRQKPAAKVFVTHREKLRGSLTLKREFRKRNINDVAGEKEGGAAEWVRRSVATAVERGFDLSEARARSLIIERVARGFSRNNWSTLVKRQRFPPAVYHPADGSRTIVMIVPRCFREARLGGRPNR